MMDDIKKCPYCGEEIKAAAKKCKHCGEWLTERGIGQPKSSLDHHIPEIKVNKVIIFTIMTFIALISEFNLAFEAYNLEVMYEMPPMTFSVCCFSLLILSAIIFTIVSVIRNRAILISLRYWIALEVFCLCAPILMIFFMNGMEYISRLMTLCLTAILGLISFFITKYLNNNTIISIYTLGSTLYVTLSVIIFLTFKG